MEQSPVSYPGNGVAFHPVQLTVTFPTHSGGVSSQKEAAPCIQSGCGEMRRQDGWSRQGSWISTFGLEGIRCFDTPTEQCLNI